ncbi:hypothetical protein GCM10010415_65160 [Streptomyces atrovirens]
MDTRGHPHGRRTALLVPRLSTFVRTRLSTFPGTPTPLGPGRSPPPGSSPPPITHLTLLRAHLLTPHRFKDLLALRRRTGIRLTLVCHRRKTRPFLERELRQVEHHIAEASALLPETEPAPLPSLPAVRPLANRWISLSAPTTFKAFDEATGPCRCAAPTATDRDFFPPAMPPVTEAEVAWRLHRASASPHLAAQLATATFTAASTTQLDTARARDLGPDTSTITLHDHGLRQGCMTRPVLGWARPLRGLLHPPGVSRPAPTAPCSATRCAVQDCHP